MGITIHYRGTIDDLNRVEELEDRVIDLVFALGGKATVWRSWSDTDRTRVLRGLMVEMAPGQETLSLVISPEGHFTPLFQMEEAEQAPFAEPPYCFCKTQFGSLQGHIAVVHLLDAIRQNFCSNLEISDEGEYFETRDAKRLAAKMDFLGSAIKSMADGLREHGLNDEAAEDPNIIAARIARVAMLVQQKLSGNSDAIQADNLSNAEDSQSNESDWNESSLEEEVVTFDRMRRQSNLRSERMVRRIDEATAAGMSALEALELAMQEEGLAIRTNRLGEVESSSNESATDEAVSNEAPSNEAPSSPLESSSFDESSLAMSADTDEPHPVLELAEQFLVTVMELAEADTTSSAFFTTIVRSATDMVGGLAQATCEPWEGRYSRALAITQLKRSLSGHAFARGAIFGLRSDKAINKVTSDELHEQLETILAMIHELTEQAWDSPEFS